MIEMNTPRLQNGIQKRGKLQKKQFAHDDQDGCDRGKH